MKINTFKAVAASLVMASTSNAGNATSKKVASKTQMPRLMNIANDTLTRGLGTSVIIGKDGKRTEFFDKVGLGSLYRKLTKYGLKTDSAISPIPTGKKPKISGRTEIIGMDPESSLPVSGIKMTFEDTAKKVPILAPTNSILISKTTTGKIAGMRRLELLDASGLHTYSITNFARPGAIDYKPLGTSFKKGDTLGFAIPIPNTNQYEVKLSVGNVPQGLHSAKLSGTYLGYVNPTDSEYAGNIAAVLKPMISKN